MREIIAFIVGTAQVVLVLLKAFNVIQWEWEYVLMPLWVPLVGLIAGIIIYAAATILKGE